MISWHNRKSNVNECVIVQNSSHYNIHTHSVCKKEQISFDLDLSGVSELAG